MFSYDHAAETGRRGPEIGAGHSDRSGGLERVDKRDRLEQTRPREVYGRDEERQHAKGLAATGETRILRVARYCPHCGRTVMVELEIPPTPPDVTPMPLGLDTRLKSVLSREGELPSGPSR